MPAGDYEVGECIGRGTFGDVYRASNIINQKIVAIKVINLDETVENINVLIQEIQFLSRLRSPHITEYIETFVNNVDMWIVMEYCGGGSCADLLKCHKRLSEDVTAYIIREVLRGLSYLHKEKKVHRDIKAANILLTSDGMVKLADFGVSGQITMTQMKRNTFVGTPFWMAPEVITRNKGYDEKADIWSTGITTIELVTGAPPFSGQSPMKILFEIPKKKPPVLTGQEYSDNIRDFIKYCLLKDPKKRPSSTLLLHHKFVTNVKRHLNLVDLIEQKNEWFEVYGKKKSPRSVLQVSPHAEPENVVRWDLDTTRKNTPMEQSVASTNEIAEPLAQKTPIEVLLYCFSRVKLRARLETTQEAITELMKTIYAQELKHPGLVEAVLEELSRFSY